MIPFGYCHCGCGKKTNIRKDQRKSRGQFKGQPCMYLKGHAPSPRAGSGPAHPSWKGDAISKDGGRKRAWLWYRNIGPCSVCGNPKSERHHIDGDTKNNAPDNIKILCHAHHMELHPVSPEHSFKSYTAEQRSEFSRRGGHARFKALSPERLTEIGKLGNRALRARQAVGSDHVQVVEVAQ